jgi:hypothetical protein
LAQCARASRSVGNALGKEAGEFVSNGVGLSDHEGAARVEADEVGARDSVGSSLDGVVGDKRIVLGVDEERRHLIVSSS